jgi:hypothetical protein
MTEDPRRLASELQDPFLRRSVVTALHFRRYLPFYVFGALWVVTLAAFPSVSGLSGGEDDDEFSAESTLSSDGANAAASGAAANGAALPDSTAAGGTAAAGATLATGGTGATATGTGARAGARAGAAPAGTRAGSAGGEAAATAGGAAAPAADAIQRGVGTTRGGIECKAGVQQIPISSYAAPCQNKYDGPNGGATFRGITDKEILVVRREFPDSANSQAAAAVAEQAGAASEDEAKMVRDTFIAYFNKAFELYGRTVKWVDYESENGNSTDEAQSKGKEGACLDADHVVKEMKAFASSSGSSPYSECAAERKMPVFSAAAYYPESFFRKYHPYLWGGAMECERISYQVGEYIGKRLGHNQAKWAGDAATRVKSRVYGTYVPDNDGYQRCVGIFRGEMKKYGVEPGPKYDYQLDISRFPDQAAQASVQFAAAGVTTLILACDFISAVVLTEAASRQNWHPEWLSIGVGGTDIDNTARLYDQAQVDGHLFGQSQLGATGKLGGPTSEPGRLFKMLTGKEIPSGTDGGYFTLVRVYSMLQAAGPNLTPEAIARGVMTLPPTGAPDFPIGYGSFLDGPDGTPGAGDHTLVEDSREVFWVNGANNKSSEEDACIKNADPYFNSPTDGCAGTFKETYGGKRFRNGEWPKEEPPVYPPH